MRSNSKNTLDAAIHSLQRIRDTQGSPIERRNMLQGVISNLTLVMFDIGEEAAERYSQPLPKNKGGHPA